MTHSRIGNPTNFLPLPDPDQSPQPDRRGGRGDHPRPRSASCRDRQADQQSLDEREDHRAEGDRRGGDDLPDRRHDNWNVDQWERIVSYYPYGIIGMDRQKENLIAKHTGSPMAWLRADWFTFAASQPPHDDSWTNCSELIRPGSGHVHIQLDAALGVIQRRICARDARCVRDSRYSGVSGANRLIERHELGSHQGAYWVSYDFTPLSAERTDDLTLAPLGPVGAGLTDDPERMFNHDGGEMIYHLPNGLQGYMLTTHDGKRLDRAPIEIVQDDNRQDKVIINGISCMACHDKGMSRPSRLPTAL